MPTQEDRIAAVERATSEYRPVLQNFAYELTMVKGLIVTQTEITQGLKQDMDEVKKEVNQVNERLTRMESQLETILSLLKPS
jgi:predicted  nucleic acid-binding Zn-ribbon protein